MKMNRLRNVAVRMRPAADPTSNGMSERLPTVPGNEVQRDQFQVPRQDAQATPRRISTPKDPAHRRRQIWDLEETGPTTPDPAPQTAKDHAPQPSAAQKPLLLTPSQPVDGHAKTRIIGFHTQSLGLDPKDIEAERDTGPLLPAGFLVVTDGPGRGAFFPISTRVSSIGRGEDQDIKLAFGDESISREGHASVVYDEEQNRFYLGHGNKANVVRRNGMPVLATEELEHCDLIRVGKTTLRFHAFCGPDFTWTDRNDSAGGEND